MRSLAAKQSRPESRQRTRSAAPCKEVSSPPSRATPFAGLVVQRSPACACGGGCPLCSEGTPDIQAKLKIGRPGDRYEEEAERVAEKVMRTTEPQLQRACACSGGCPECRAKQPGQEHESLLAQPVVSSVPEQPAGPPIVHEVLRSLGQPLHPEVRAFMEARFGHDFSRVRLHADTKAAESARAVNAQAYTVGWHVVFDMGRYAPETDRGRRLLAHELTHVVQQEAAVPNTEGLRIGQKDGTPERQAEAVADAATPGVAPIVFKRIPGAIIQRAAPAAAAPVAISVLIKRCIIGALGSMALDAAIQYGTHLWRLRRWPWERARETWESYRHNWCVTVLAAVLGCFGGIAAARWIEPFLRSRFPSALGGAAGGTLLGRLFLWLATQGLLAPRFAVKWLGKMGCIPLEEAEGLHTGISREIAMAERPGSEPGLPSATEALA